jgi:uncharacterized protein (DUF2267 family)
MTAQSTFDIFQSTLQKTESWIQEFQQHTGREDEEKTWQMLRSVLHTLRDRLTVEQAAHLSAQLPLFIRGLFFEGWNPADVPTGIRSRDDFVQAVADRLSEHPEIDPNQAIDGTVHVLTRNVTDGEIDKIVRSLPDEMGRLFDRN